MQAVIWGINPSMSVKSDCQVKPAYLSRFEPLNSNLPKMSCYNTGCNLQILLCLAQEFRREGWTETAVILCKLNKSL